MSVPEQAVAIPTGTWQADVVHSSLGFEVPYLGSSTFSCIVEDFEVALADGVLTGSARVASVVTRDESLQAQLLSPDFFDVERHPTIDFTGSATPNAGLRAEFDGDFRIRGIRQPATLIGTVTGPVVDPFGNEGYDLSLSTTIDRTRFGIRWNAPLPHGSAALAGDVTFRADLLLIKA